MGYRATDPSRLTKLEFGSYLAASLAYLVRHQQDSPGVISFDRAIRDFIPPKQGQRHLFTILAKLESLGAQGETDHNRILKLIAQRLKRRGVIVLISDCHGDPDHVSDGVRHLAARGHEVILIHLLDHDEVTFPFKSLASFRDLETRAQVMTDPIRLRKVYLDRLGRFQESIKAGALSAGADYRFVDTSEPIELVLRDYLLYRRQRGK
jgi:uncharacterized protein (DUF58 family)